MENQHKKQLIFHSKTCLDKNFRPTTYGTAFSETIKFEKVGKNNNI
jgi:hypothetical protein